ncbi:beta-ketoacyl-[acyl-carrier-protein] synthase family protein [Sphingobium sufflavum]|uniref:beta-ketoacyl-[acyl-carrier-protein] synthase family protein n=1 Tax=Sphingobium sufflavum TaxID=1129547 RepID=UPI002277E374|nr:beta-ketoacyl-[acyl-carrier-protein] synthase family protein [Sphingobium sufflavum]MCE7796555.1 beta-ketoacyl-[acyl-carrier-protein] synthase family protein [Sphingobium sufflavum]
MTQRVVITGMGCVSGLGTGVEQTWAKARKGQGAIRRLDRPGLSGVAAAIENAEELAKCSDWRRLGRLDPLSLYALTAADEALTAAGLVGHPVLQRRTALVVGCGSGGNATVDAAYERLYARHAAKVHPQTIPSSMISAPASHIAMTFGVQGPTFVLASACASSTHAIGEAMHMIRSGRVDVAITGGAEACLTPGSWVAWQSLGAMAPDACRPFSRDRCGMVLGEGAALMVLESEDHARARGARILGEVAGYGASCDARDITAPDTDGIVAAIRAAHEDAGIHPATPALISSHGTGTPLNDAAETRALRTVYGTLGSHAVIATKSAHGHMIGATGAMEFLLGIMAIREGMAPPTLNYIGPDPDCDLPLVLTPKPIDQQVVISNSFAFGGLNAVLIGRAP